MSTVHLVGGEKGGVGKSVVARLLSQLFIDRGAGFAALDADQSHGALLRSYTEFTQPVDLSRLESADQILDRALGADRRVVVDLPAQSHRALRRWIDATDVLTYAREMDVRLVLWHVTDGGFDSVSELKREFPGLARPCTPIRDLFETVSDAPLQAPYKAPARCCGSPGAGNASRPRSRPP